MQDPSGTRFDALRLKTIRRFGLAALIVAGGALSLGAQAQSTSGDNQAAVAAGLSAAVQNGIQTIKTAQSNQAAGLNKQTAKPKPATLVAQNQAPQGTLVAQAPTSTPSDQTAATDQTAAPEQQLQEVVVTGSLIARPASETAEAITVVNADSLKAQGVQNVEQALSTITANSPTVSIASSAGTFTGGGTYANLRELGDGRTLVLLDGQRLAPNAFNGSGVDLAGIPFSAIQSVQVLREGASSLYGSDAIAGVINFITKKNYQGVEVEGQLDRPQHPRGGSSQLDIVLGHGDLVNDGYNAMLTVDYTHQQELQAPNRAFAAYGFNPAGGYTSTNYPGNWPGLFIDGAKNVWQPGYPACAGNNQLTTYFGDCEYRYSAATDLLPDSHEVSGLLSLTKALPANNQLQLQYFLTQSEVTDFSGPMFYSFDVSPTSPYFPAAAGLTCESAPCTALDTTHYGHVYFSDPNNERYNGNFNVAQRVLLTFSGSNAGWDYTADVNLSRNQNDNRNVKDYPEESILAPTTNPATGNPILSNLINPFGPESAAGQALINSSYINGVYQIGRDTRWSVDGHASHPLGDVFNANMPATFAVGFDVGGERFTNYTTPYNDVSMAATGLGDSTATGSRQTQAIYAELDVPMAHHIDLDISDRQDRYSDFGLTNNGKLALRYSPIPDFLTFRGTASTGFRAPTLYNLYDSDFLTAATSGTMGAGNPFCESGNYTTLWTPATCATQGLRLSGGNSKLQPETSENFDLGVIFQPIQNLGVTVDYFRVVVKDTVGTVPAASIYQNPTALAPYIVPNAAGTLTASINEASQCLPYTAPTCGYLLTTDQNTGFLATDGLDLSVQYLLRTAFGRFNFDLEGTDVTQFLQQQYNGGPTLTLVNWWNEVSTGPVYHWSHNLRVDWTSPAGMWSAGITNRFYSHFRDQFPDGDGNVRWVGSYTIWDIYASVKPIKNLNVLFGIKNLLDTSPPYTNAYQDNFAAGYDAITADPLLRDFYVDLKYDFF